MKITAFSAAFFVFSLAGAISARAELPVDEAVYTESNGALITDDGEDAQVILVKDYVGPGSSYSNSDGVSWENGVCQHGCHRDVDNDSSSRRKNHN